MNQLYRALHIPPKRLLRKLSGEKEIYTIAVRPVPKAEGTDPLPALGGTPYTMLPARPGFWYADPLLYHRDGRRDLHDEDLWILPNRHHSHQRHQIQRHPVQHQTVLASLPN